MMGVFTNGGNRCEGAICSIAALPCFLIATVCCGSTGTLRCSDPIRSESRSLLC